jgi:hypothetical protein
MERSFIEDRDVKAAKFLKRLAGAGGIVLLIVGQDA